MNVNTYFNIIISNTMLLFLTTPLKTAWLKVYTADLKSTFEQFALVERDEKMHSSIAETHSSEQLIVHRFS